MRSAPRLATLPPGPPLLQVIVDTEEEFDWSKPVQREQVATRSLEAQAVAQGIFDQHGVRPTYVVDYPVAVSPEAALLQAFLDSGRCLIGSHLHPWVNPPLEEPVTPFNSYPGNLAPALERRKLEVLTEAIAHRFGVRPLLYKAG